MIMNLSFASFFFGLTVLANPLQATAQLSSEEDSSIEALENALNSQSGAMQVPVASEEELSEEIRKLEKEEADLSHQVYLLRVKVAATQAKIAEQERVNQKKFDKKQKP